MALSIKYDMTNKEMVDNGLITVNKQIEDLGRLIKEKQTILECIGYLKIVYKDLILLSDMVYNEEYKIEENLKLIRKFTKTIKSKLTYKNILSRYYGRETTMFLVEQW